MEDKCVAWDYKLPMHGAPFSAGIQVVERGFLASGGSVYCFGPE